MKTIEQLKEDIVPILKKHKINRAGVFGSYAKDENTEESDIDILIELGEKISLLDFIRIKFALEDKLGKKVDLVDVTGRVIYSQDNINATNTTIEDVLATNQMLIVRITTQNQGVLNQKIIYRIYPYLN